MGDEGVEQSCGHSKFDTQRDCLTCLQFAVDALNQSSNELRQALSNSQSENASLRAEVARLHEESLIRANEREDRVRELDAAREQVARLEKERDELHQATTKRLNICAQEVFMTMRQAEEATSVAHDLRVKFGAAEARIRELEETSDD